MRKKHTAHRIADGSQPSRCYGGKSRNATREEKGAAQIGLFTASRSADELRGVHGQTSAAFGVGAPSWPINSGQMRCQS